MQTRGLSKLSVIYFLFLELEPHPRSVESESLDIGPRQVCFKYNAPMSLVNVWELLHRPPKYDSTSQICGTCKPQRVLLYLLGGRDEGKVSTLNTGEL